MRTAPAESLLAALTALSQVVCDIEQIVALKLSVCMTLDAATVHEPHLTLAAHRMPLSIVPYPRSLEEDSRLGRREDHGGGRSGREDEAAHRAFVAAMTPEDLRLRFFGAVRGFDHSQLARMTQIDYDREMALIAEATDESGAIRTLGVVRAIADPDNETAEFAVAVRSDSKGKRLGIVADDPDHCV